MSDILVIGGGPAGVVAALTARKNYPDKKITLVRKQKKAVIPCAIPYIFQRLKSIDEDVIPDQPLIDNQIDLVIGEVVKIDPEAKKVSLKNNQNFNYEKLILALGSDPHLIPIEGTDLKGVWQVKKDYNYLKELREAILAAKNIVIIGGGFIGVEFAEELSNIKDKSITLVELSDHCLCTALDDEFTQEVEKKLKENNVKIYTKTGIEKIKGQNKVEKVKLNNGQELPADLVLISIGARPNIEIAKKAGLKVEEKGAIWVDEYLRTSQADILAVGDCAQTRDFITGQNCPIMLASTACTEARIAANNLYQIKLVRENKGTMGAFSTKIGNLVLGAAGLIEKRAQEQKIDYVIGLATAQSHHPGKLPASQPITIKLLFAKSSENLLLGGQVMGPASISEMTNVFALAIQQKTSIFDLETAQISTHPLCTAAPTCHPLIMAAEDALSKIKQNL